MRPGPSARGPELPRLPPHLLARPRLFAQLDRRAPLTIVRAPAGFGKTVLVAHWLAQRPGPGPPTVWLTARDGPHFWPDLARAARRARIAAPADSHATTVVRALAAADRPALVIVDGMDLAAERPELAHLRGLVRDTRRLRLIVCGRGGSAALADGADVETVTITSDDLLFTPAETRELPVGPGRALGPRWAATLHTQTGGWPRLTCVAAQALAGHLDEPSSRADAGIADGELVARVVQACVREQFGPLLAADAPGVPFARALAVSPTVDAELAATLTGAPDAAQRLHRLAAGGLLVGRIECGQLAYRWLEPARRDLLAGLAPAALSELHSRAGRWHARRGAPAPALHHAARGGDWAQVVGVVEQCWPLLLIQHTDVLDDALERAPRPAIARSARAAAVRDIRLQLTGRDPGDGLNRLANPLPADRGEIEALGRTDRGPAALNTGCALMIAFRVRGDLPAARGYAERIDPLAHSIRAGFPPGTAPMLPDALVQVGVTFLIAGDLDRAGAALEEGYVRRQESRGGGGVEADAAATLALLHALNGDVATAERWVARFRAAPAPTGWMSPRIRHSVELSRALIAVERLDDETATGTLRRLEREVTAEHSWRPFLSYAQAQHALLWGDRYGALRRLRADRARDRHWLAGPATMRALLDDAEDDLLLALGQATEARARLARRAAATPPAARLALLAGNAVGAADLAGEALRSAAGPRSRAELLLVSALARARLGAPEAAADALRNAVDCARVTTAVRAFATVPRAELAALAERVPTAAALLDHPVLRLAPAVFPAALETVELTEREATLLAELGSGASLPQIARRLSVSPNTVKSHARTLYRKLGANSRDEALARARRLGLAAPARRPSG